MEMQIKTEYVEDTELWKIRIYAEGDLVAWILQSFEGHGTPWFELQKMLDATAKVYLTTKDRWHWTWPCGDSCLSSSATFDDREACQESADNCEAIVRKMSASMRAEPLPANGSAEVTP